MKKGFIFCLTSIALTVPAAWAQNRLVAGGDQVQVGRYTTQAAKPPVALADPLLVNAQLNFPRQTVTTVGQALDYTLMRTGYRLVEVQAMGQQARHFLGLPLPESQRRMGPYAVKTILQTLLGTVWTLRTDPINRQVWFELEVIEPSPLTPVATLTKTLTEPEEPVRTESAEAGEQAIYQN